MYILKSDQDFVLIVVGAGLLALMLGINWAARRLPVVGNYLSGDESLDRPSKTLRTLLFPVRLVLGFSVLLVPGYVVYSLGEAPVGVYLVREGASDVRGETALLYPPDTLRGHAGLLVQAGLAHDWDEVAGVISEEDLQKLFSQKPHEDWTVIANLTGRSVYHQRVQYFSPLIARYVNALPPGTTSEKVEESLERIGATRLTKLTLNEVMKIVEERKLSGLAIASGSALVTQVTKTPRYGCGWTPPEETPFERFTPMSRQYLTWITAVPSGLC